MLPEKPLEKEASGSLPKEKEGSSKRQGIEVPPHPSLKKSKAGGSKEKPNRGELGSGPSDSEVAAAAGKTVSRHGVFLACPMNLSTLGAPTVLEGSGSSGPTNQKMALVTSLGIRVLKMNKNLSSDAMELKRKNDSLLGKDARWEQISKELNATLKREVEINEGYKSLVKTLEDKLDVFLESSKILEKEKEEARVCESQAVERAKAAEAKVVALEQEMAKLRANP